MRACVSIKEYNNNNCPERTSTLPHTHSFSAIALEGGEEALEVSSGSERVKVFLSEHFNSIGYIGSSHVSLASDRFEAGTTGRTVSHT